MVNLFDIMRQAQSGAAMANLSRQFGLSAEQTQRALEAILPVFTLGLQRSSQDPNSFGKLLEMMMSGRFAPFYDPGFGGGMPGAAASGQQVIEQLFGSADANRRIAAEAAGLAGVTSQILQQMMPVVAATLMGGLFRGATVEGMAEFLRGLSDWLRTVGDPGRSRPTPTASPYQAWSDAVAAMFGQPKQPSQPTPTDPWSAMMGAMLRLGPQAAPPPSPPPSVPNPFEALSRMFESGRDAQVQHLASMQRIVDDLWAPKRPA